MYLMINSVLLQVDILVSSQDACSQAIITAGGEEMRRMLKPLHPFLNTGDIMVTPGFKLACDHVIHTKCSEWNGGKGETVSV